MAHTHSHHDHHGHHHHHHQPSQFNLAFALATLLNLAFTLIEAGYALSAHSSSLLADAGHNLGDVFGLMMAWGATLLLGRRAAEKYSYGYKKTTILSALANAMLLVFTSGIIIYEAINKLLHPVAINEITVMIIATIGIVINGGTALLFVRGNEKDLNIKATFLHLAYDALISGGVVIAALIVYFTGWLFLDPLVGIIIVMIILIGTSKLLRNSIDLILGAVPHDINLAAVRTYLSELNGVVTVHDLHIWGLSTQENALTAHLVMPDASLSDADYEKINHVLKHQFKINHVTLQIERGLSANPCGQAIVC
jgi:cobalt-zinc-cadmium efflux system protein